MPYTRAQLLQALRTDHPQFAQVDDNKLFAAIAQDHPELARGISELQQPEKPPVQGDIRDTPLGAMLIGVSPEVFGQRILGAGASLINGLFPSGDTRNPNAQLPELTPEQEVGAKTATLGGIATAVDPLVGALGQYGRSAAGSAAKRLYESALKPGPRSNTLPEVQRMVQTGLTEGIPVSPRGVSRTDALVKALNQQVDDVIGNNPHVAVNKFDVASRLSDTARRAADQVNPEADLRIISKSGNEFLRNQPSEIQAAMAQALKKGTYRKLGDAAYGEIKSASRESQKALARGLREELASQITELNPLNRREGSLLSLRDELEAAVNRQRNKEMLGIGTPLATAGVGAITGSGPLAALAGVSKHLIDRPGIKSRLAIALARLAR